MSHFTQCAPQLPLATLGGCWLCWSIPRCATILTELLLTAECVRLLLRVSCQVTVIGRVC